MNRIRTCAFMRVLLVSITAVVFFCVVPVSKTVARAPQAHVEVAGDGAGVGGIKDEKFQGEISGATSSIVTSLDQERDEYKPLTEQMTMLKLYWFTIFNLFTQR